MTAAVPRDSGGDDIDLVAKVALDSAEIANRSARAASHTASKLAEVTAHFDRALAQQRRQMILIVSLSGLVAIIAFAMFIASAIQLRGRVVQVNAMLNVMATRSIELRQGLDQIGPLAERVEGFATEVGAMNRAQSDLQATLQKLDRTLAARPVPVAPPVAVAPQPSPPAAPAPGAVPTPPKPAAVPAAETSEQMAARERLIRQTLDAVQAVAAQTKTLEAGLRSQSATLSALNGRVTAIEQGVAALPVMQSDLKLLLKNDQSRSTVVERVTAERRREESLREERERFVQFPRQDGSSQPATSGGNRPAQGAVPAQ